MIVNLETIIFRNLLILNEIQLRKMIDTERRWVYVLIIEGGNGAAENNTGCGDPQGNGKRR